MCSFVAFTSDDVLQVCRAGGNVHMRMSMSEKDQMLTQKVELHTGKKEFVVRTFSAFYINFST